MPVLDLTEPMFRSFASSVFAALAGIGAYMVLSTLITLAAQRYGLSQGWGWDASDGPIWFSPDAEEILKAILGAVSGGLSGYLSATRVPESKYIASVLAGVILVAYWALGLLFVPGTPLSGGLWAQYLLLVPAALMGAWFSEMRSNSNCAQPPSTAGK